MAMANIDLPTLRELAGHASIQMTMRYVHPTPEHKRSAIRKLEQFRSQSQEASLSSVHANFRTSAGANAVPLSDPV